LKTSGEHGGVASINGIISISASQHGEHGAARTKQHGMYLRGVWRNIIISSWQAWQKQHQSAHRRRKQAASKKRIMAA